MRKEVKVHQVTRLKNNKVERFSQRYYHNQEESDQPGMMSGLTELVEGLPPHVERSLVDRICLQWGLKFANEEFPKEAFQAAVDDLAYGLWKAETSGEAPLGEVPSISDIAKKTVSVEGWDAVMVAHLKEQDSSWRDMKVEVEVGKGKTKQIGLTRDMSNRRFKRLTREPKNLADMQTKMVVCHRLSERLKDTDIHMLFHTDGAPCVDTVTGEIFMVFDSDSDENKKIYAENDMIIKLDRGGRRISPDDPNYNDYLREAVVSELVGAWAFDSQNSYLSADVQRVVATMTGGRTPPDISKVRHVLHPQHDELIRKFVEASYSETQDMLSAAGIDEIVVHRGFDFDPDDPDNTFHMITEASMTTVDTRSVPWGKFSGVDIVEFPTNPVASYSVKEDIAKGFSEGKKKGRAVVTLAVPARRILGTPATSIGCKDEHEVVVIGDVKPDTSIVTWEISGRSKVARQLSEKDLPKVQRFKYKQRAKTLLEGSLGRVS